MERLRCNSVLYCIGLGYVLMSLRMYMIMDCLPICWSSGLRILFAMIFHTRSAQTYQRRLAFLTSSTR